MRQHFRGLGKIFSFTFFQHVKSKGYKSTTIVIALLCLIVPILIMAGGEIFSDNNTPEPISEPDAVEIAPSEDDGSFREEKGYDIDADINSITELMLVDRSSDGLKSLLGFGDYLKDETGISVETIDFGSDFESAVAAAEGRNDVLLIVADQVGNDYEINVLTPVSTSYMYEAAENYRILLDEYSVIMKTKLNQETGKTSVNGDDAVQEDEAGEAKEVVTMIVAFLNIMVLYFFVLIYGQGVATSVVMEKSSKLMEVFLISVKPAAMIMGKLLATALSGILQLFSWIVSLILGLMLGGAAVRMLNPEAGNVLKDIFDLINMLTDGMFSPGGVIVAAFMAFSGILLYCSLAGIGGSLASKQEDLSSANLAFTMIILISFFAVLYGGGVPGIGTEIWWIKATMDWIPFTAVLITPAKILLGTVSVAKGLASLAIVLVTTVLLTVLAGKIYKSMVLYRGKVLSPRAIIKMVRER